MSSRKWLDKRRLCILLFFFTAAALFAAVLFVEPVVGVSDQNDFARVMYGVANPDQEHFYETQFTQIILPTYNYKPFPLSALIPGKAESQVWFVLAARMLSKLLGYGMFQMWIYASLLGLCYIASLTLLYAALFPKQAAHGAALGVLLLFFFLDGRWVMWFNSLYGEPVVFTGLILTLAAFFKARGEHKVIWAVLFGAGCFIMACAKLQAIALLLPAGMLAAYLLWRYLREKKYAGAAALAACLAVVVFSCLGVYGKVNGNYSRETNYQSLMTGVLVDADNPLAVLADFGLDPALAGDIGKNAYLQAEEYEFGQPSSTRVRTEFAGKVDNQSLTRYHLTHPRALLKGLVWSAEHALISSTQKDYTSGKALGIHPAGTPVTRDHHRFTLWSSLRQSLPHSFPFLVIVLFLALAAGGWMLKKRMTAHAIALFAAAAGGVLQFVMPYMFNGRCDTAKQLLVFTFLFDLIIFALVLFAARAAKTIPRRARQPKK
ncbi:MAG: hypothetical protein LBT60_01825 [Oscillospiraceae bacterium]|jgi:hypothetical protein|nr:hypothetical protein [Oscillospiraceae bacterium]